MKKIVLICLALVLAMGGLGVGYAMWSDKVTIGGTVNTDTLCIQWTDNYGSDDPLGQGNTDHTVTVGHDYVLDPPDAKDVGYTVVEKVNDKTLRVTIYNAYPSYAVEVKGHIRNCGSVPVEKGECTITYPDPRGGEPITVPLPDATWTAIPGPGILNGDPGIYDVYEIHWGNGTGSQLDPHDWPGVGDEEDSFYVHVLQPALQGQDAETPSPYTFTITRDAWNWNE